MSGPEGSEADLEAYVPAAPQSPDGTARPPWRKAGIAIGVVVALVAGLFGLAAITSDGGEDSPEAAVQKLVDAIENEDVLGALEALVPAERAVLRGRVTELGDQLRRLGIVDESLDLGGIAGADVTVQNLELQTERLADDVAAVRATKGTVGLRIKGEELPIGPLLKGLVEDPSAISSPPPADLTGEDVVLVAVRRDGKWFVSLGYTMAELARREGGDDVPKFGEGVTPKGASSAEAAVRELAEAAVAFDVRRAVELTPPGEADALHDYAPLFLPAAERVMADLREEGFRVEIPTLDLDVTSGSGDGEAVVTVKSLKVKVTSTESSTGEGEGEDEFLFDYDGRCVKMSGLFGADLPPLCREDENEFQPFAGAAFSYFQLTVVEHGGSWFVSPTRSVLDGMLGSLRVLERDKLASEVKDRPFGLFYLFFPTPLIYGMGGFSSGESVSFGSASSCVNARVEGTSEVQYVEEPCVRTPEAQPAVAPTTISIPAEREAVRREAGEPSLVPPPPSEMPTTSTPSQTNPAPVDAPSP